MRARIKSLLGCVFAAALLTGGLATAGDPLQDLLKGLQPKKESTSPSTAGSSSQTGTKGSTGKTTEKPKPGPTLSDLGLGVIRAVAGYTEEEEVAIGRQAAGNILGAAPLVKNDPLQQYVNRVGRWVANQSERRDLEWHFGVIESKDINAFAAPGGYIFVTDGLYRKLSSEGELAGVLAHEVGHVIRKHHLKILQQGQLIDMGGQMLSAQAGENQTIKNLLGNGAEIFARSLDKGAEYEADRMAVVLAGRSGYDPFGLPAVLQEIGHVGRKDDRVALLFKTHPHPDDRLNELGGAMGNRLDNIKGQTLEARLYRIKP